jgi:hypothetical protein
MTLWKMFRGGLTLLHLGLTGCFWLPVENVLQRGRSKETVRIRGRDKRLASGCVVKARQQDFFTGWKLGEG